MPASSLSLPASMTSTRDVRQAIRQLEQFEELLAQSTATHSDGESAEPPRLIAELLVASQREAKTQSDLKVLKAELESLLRTSPRLKFAFASEPDDVLLIRLVTWLRENINPGVLVDISLTPSIAGGFVMQTPSRRYDFSWRRLFDSQGEHFAELLKATDKADNNAE